jgi:hypothetical protein
MDPEPASGIRARGNHTALFGPSTDSERLAYQRGITLLFDGTEESIQVQMNDSAWHRHISWEQSSSLKTL